MTRDEIQRLHRARGGDARSVATRIVGAAADELTAAEEAYLREHLPALPAQLLVQWLALRPREGAARIVAAIAEEAGGDGEVLAWHLLRHQPTIDPDAWADLVACLRERIAPHVIAALLARTKGCDAFEAVARVDEGPARPTVQRGEALPRDVRSPPPAGLALLEARYDPEASAALARCWVIEHAERAFLRAVRVASSHARIDSEDTRRALASAVPSRAVAELRDAKAIAPWLVPCDTLADLARDRAARTQDGGELRVCLEVLAAEGVARREFVPIALARLADIETSEPVLSASMAWLGAELATRSAWEQHGVAVLRTIFRRWPWDVMGPLVHLLDAATARAFGREHQGFSISLPPPPLTPAPFMPQTHEALARVFIAAASRAIERGETESARSLLASLVHLAPPSRVVRELVRLRERAAGVGELAELVELNIGFLRREDGRGARFEAILEALRELGELSPALFDE